MKKIFIIEDDESLRDSLIRILQLQGFEAAACTDFAKAGQTALTSGADALVVDLRLPENDGLAIVREVRAQSTVPILVLTSSDGEFDEIMSMKLGADDYLTKPYSPAVLMAHIERLLERGNADEGLCLSYRGVSLDISRSQVSYQDKTQELSRNEMRILNKLMLAQGCIVSRQELMYELWQSDEFVDDNTLTVNVNRLRHSLEFLGVPEDFLKTHRGQGYSL